MDRIIHDFTNLIASIRMHNPSIKIIISSILPRPIDDRQTKDTICNVNKNLYQLSDKLKFKFVRNYSVRS